MLEGSGLQFLADTGGSDNLLQQDPRDVLRGSPRYCPFYFSQSSKAAPFTTAVGSSSLGPQFSVISDG